MHVYTVYNVNYANKPSLIPQDPNSFDAFGDVSFNANPIPDPFGDSFITTPQKTTIERNPFDDSAGMNSLILNLDISNASLPKIYYLH